VLADRKSDPRFKDPDREKRLRGTRRHLRLHSQLIPNQEIKNSRSKIADLQNPELACKNLELSVWLVCVWAYPCPYKLCFTPWMRTTQGGRPVRVLRSVNLSIRGNQIPHQA